MSGAVPRVKHVVVEMRYEPALALYGVMDSIGLHFASQYPDWERTPLTLEIRDKKAQRRAVFTHNRSFFEVVDPSDVQAELDRALKIFDRLQHALKFTVVRRIGIRQWASVKVEEKFDKLARELSRKLYSQQASLSQALHGNIEDFLYAVNVRNEQGWKYHLKAGPMERKQWFEVIPYEQALFQEGKFEEFKSSMPELMLFIDIDGMRESFPYSDLTSATAAIRRGCDEVRTDLANYLMG